MTKDNAVLFALAEFTRALEKAFPESDHERLDGVRKALDRVVTLIARQEVDRALERRENRPKEPVPRA
jgi:hypothetical protein